MNWSLSQIIIASMSLVFSVIGYLLKLNINNVMNKVKDNEMLLFKSISDINDLKDRATEMETEVRIRVENSEQSRIRLEKAISDMREETKDSLHEINNSLKEMWNRLDRRNH